MSAIIIYGSFKLTITERLSVIGTFLSQGATNWNVEKILFFESIGYGAVGAILGDALGYGGLYLVNTYISKLSDIGNIESFSVDPRCFLMGSAFAIIFSVISAFVPILRIRKLEVKEVILNNVNISMSIGWKRFIIGTNLIVISILINSRSEEWVNYLSGILILVSVIGVILMYPKIIDLLTNFLFKIFRGKSKVIILALNNLKTSKVLMGNITLIVISMLSIFMITSIGTSLKNLVVGAYDVMNFDISVSNIVGVPGINGYSITDKIIDKIKGNPNIDLGSIQISKEANAKVNNETMAFFEGIDSDKYQSFNSYLELDNSKYRDMYKRFQESTDSEIIITDKLKKSLNVKVGDKVSVEVNDIKKDLKIIGIIDGKLYYTGQFILMKNSDMKKEFMIEEASKIVFKTTKSQEEVRDELKPVIKELGAKVITKDEIQKDNIENNQLTVNILSIFSYLAIFIATLGVLNNIIISFLQRKRELAVLSSIGMSDGSRSKMLLTESILSVIWAVAIAMPYSYLGLSLLTKTMTIIGLPMDIVLDVKSVPVYGVAALILILLASLPIMLKNKKLSIINELKYE
nr:FtsX-like permease family protein [Clostridium cibarium]